MWPDRSGSCSGPSRSCCSSPAPTWPTCSWFARSGGVAVRWSTLLFTGVVSALAALLCGTLPALRASEPSLDRLRDGSRGSTSRRHWARDGLVVAQTALALVLLTGSALLLRSFQKMRQVDPGYDTRDVFTFQIAPEGQHPTDAASFA